MAGRSTRMRERAAVLAGVAEHGRRGRGRRRLQVGVGKDQVGRLAAQLQGDPLDRPGRPGHDALPDLGRAGEGDLGHVRVLDQPPADHPARPGEHVDHPWRDARLGEVLAQRAVSGVSPAGLSTTVLPAARAGASFQEAMVRGKFQGTISPTTPSGSWKVRSTPPATGMVSPSSRSGAPA